ncbi:MAG: AraC family transcriptional regulator [Alphaproteobacteria bacterium]|nr:AraC family transcriptional regulator [Alphaproteobacteria bacterium]MBU1548689.1 AraC family transcriptional regulator [Alphaproteobacteria bacterium]MBU2335515.1 AraC family transcriptional regulator [Alphaproteobacteria bacterium]MBU2391090.1 AraC family transcriptional regulator [Alphaproteobacteria bacterium]
MLATPTALPQLDELAAIVAQNTRDDGIFDTDIPRLSLIRFSTTTQPLQTLQHPALCIIVQGSKQVMLADEIYVYGPARHLVVSVDLPVSSQIIEASPDKPYLCIRLDLDLPALGTMIMEVAPPAAEPAGICSKAICLAETSPQFLESALRLLRLLDSPDDIAYLAPLAERELMYRLLRGPQAHKVRRMLMPDSRLQQVNRAIAWIRQNYAAPFSIEQLAAEARMSPSSLHQHFRDVTAMSPLQYQKQLRLQEARRLILANAYDAATAAQHVGYDSPSQFSREYRRLFGAPPIQDVTRLKQEPGRYVEA